jgi:hypothetical protein
VIAAVTLPFHNGRTEGVNTKAKMINRQSMAEPDSPLLRAEPLPGKASCRVDRPTTPRHDPKRVRHPRGRVRDHPAAAVPPEGAVSETAGAPECAFTCG